MKVLTTAPPGHPDWHRAHEGKISGSSIGNILGVGWSTPYQEWLYLTKKRERPDISRKVAVRRGIALEQLAADLWTEETGLMLAPSPGTIEHPTLPYACATIDRRIYPTASRGSGVWEGKTASAYLLSKWEEEGVPLGYQYQLTFYCDVVGDGWGSFGALVGDEYRWQHIEAVKHREKVMNTVVEFYERYVLKDVPPPVQAGDESFLKGEVVHDGSVVVLPPAAREAWTRSREAAEHAKGWEDVKQQANAEVLLAMGNATYGKLDVGYVKHVQVAEQVIESFTRKKSSHLRGVKEVK